MSDPKCIGDTHVFADVYSKIKPNMCLCGEKELTNPPSPNYPYFTGTPTIPTEYPIENLGVNEKLATYLRSQGWMNREEVLAEYQRGFQDGVDSAYREREVEMTSLEETIHRVCGCDGNCPPDAEDIRIANKLREDGWVKQDTIEYDNARELLNLKDGSILFREGDGIIWVVSYSRGNNGEAIHSLIEQGPDPVWIFTYSVNGVWQPNTVYMHADKFPLTVIWEPK